jgi:hypothetical protein
LIRAGRGRCIEHVAAVLAKLINSDFAGERLAV